MTDARQLAFTVDTHLLRELGELLVGRDSTALLELVKNSYDADATKVTVHAAGLAGDTAQIVVSDDGVGMTFALFENAFLRIASRSKEAGSRHSPRYGRRFTGAKGIGRLAAHKLARELLVHSIPAKEVLGANADELVGVEAVLDWVAMEEEHEELSSLGDALVATELNRSPGVPSGTTLTLTSVRGPWPSRRWGQFVTEVQSCQPPPLIAKTPTSKVLPHHLILSELQTRETGSTDPGFVLELTGDLAAGEEFWPTVAERSDWVLEIDSSADGIQYGIGPTNRKINELSSSEILAHDLEGPPFAQNRIYQASHPDPLRGPFFQARILVSEGSFGRKQQLRAFERSASGIRVFLEGFRVLPYGSPGDDWLKLDADYVRKSREFETLVDENFPQVLKEGYVQLGNRSYYGVVALTERGVPYLRPLVNREGFVPGEYLTSLEHQVRSGVDLVTRTRAALGDRMARAQMLKDDAELGDDDTEAKDAAAPNDIDTDGPTGEPTTPDDHRQAMEIHSSDEPAEVDRNGQGDPTTDVDVLDKLLASAISDARLLRGDAAPAGRTHALEASLDRITARLRVHRAEQVNLRTLATVGTQFSAFIHEINGLLAQAETLGALLADLASDRDLTRGQRRALRAIQSSSQELTTTLHRQASYLVDVVGPDARRRRQRLPVRERVESAIRILAPRIAQRGQRLEFEILDGLHTPPIFRAELAIVVTNLLSNATKFAGNDGVIKVMASVDEAGELHLIVANTGTRVAKQDRERFFRPFESTTTEVDLILGQGMGLGLPIVRSLAEDYNGRATFVEPPTGFATAVEVTLPDPRPGLARRSYP